jgi:hypothetical protein
MSGEKRVIARFWHMRNEFAESVKNASGSRDFDIAGR